MKALYKSRFVKMIRLSCTLSLIFFVLFSHVSCSNADPDGVEIVWENDKARSVSVPAYLLSSDALDSINLNLFIRLKGEPTTMLGNYSVVADHIIFTPAFPFTPGKEYEVAYLQKLLKRFTVPLPDSSEAPQLLTVYPSADTLPENVLKLYLEFSAPMREGESLKYVSLIDKNGDTLNETFLDLQPELWNPERTALTIWFDPGRIKRDLIPNQKLGNPLKSGEVYTLIVSSDWKDARGLSLKDYYRRNLVISTRDSTSPNPKNWDMQLPVAGSTDALKISFPEALDYFLLNDVITFLDLENNIVPGELKVTKNEKGIDFHPKLKWEDGLYLIRVGSKLEDLAGNNVNRLFERDLKQSTLNIEHPFIEIKFQIH